MTVTLTVGIVNWNTAALLSACVKSVLAQKVDGTMSIVVVDNASTDESADTIRRLFPQVRLVENSINHGFCHGLNQVAEASQTDYYLFLHSDMVLHEGAAQSSMDFLQETPGIGAMGCKLFYPNGEIFPSCHREPKLLALLLEALPITVRNSKGRGPADLYMREMDRAVIQDVDIVASAFLMVRGQALSSIGGFDEAFTNWMAEWDLCHRLRAQGWRITFVPTVTSVHFEAMAPVKTRHGDTGSEDPTELAYKKGAYLVADRLIDGLAYYYLKHYSRYQWALLRCLAIGGLTAKAIRASARPRSRTSKREAQLKTQGYVTAIRKVLSQSKKGRGAERI